MLCLGGGGSSYHEKEFTAACTCLTFCSLVVVVTTELALWSSFFKTLETSRWSCPRWSITSRREMGCYVEAQRLGPMFASQYSPFSSKSCGHIPPPPSHQPYTTTSSPLHHLHSLPPQHLVPSLLVTNQGCLLLPYREHVDIPRWTLLPPLQCHAVLSVPYAPVLVQVHCAAACEDTGVW